MLSHLCLNTDFFCFICKVLLNIVKQFQLAILALMVSSPNRNRSEIYEEGLNFGY